MKNKYVIIGITFCVAVGFVATNIIVDKQCQQQGEPTQDGLHNWHKTKDQYCEWSLWGLVNKTRISYVKEFLC